MSEIICTYHGMQSISFTSPNISERVSKKETLNDLIVVKLVLHLPFEKRGIFWVDSDFFATVDIQFENTLKSYEVKNEEIAFDIYTKLYAVCSKCLKEAISEHFLRP